MLADHLQQSLDVRRALVRLFNFEKSSVGRNLAWEEYLVSWLNSQMDDPEDDSSATGSALALRALLERIVPTVARCHKGIARELLAQKLEVVRSLIDLSLKAENYADETMLDMARGRVLFEREFQELMKTGSKA